jgi:hypothetical protein
VREPRRQTSLVRGSDAARHALRAEPSGGEPQDGSGPARPRSGEGRKPSRRRETSRTERAGESDPRVMRTLTAHVVEGARNPRRGTQVGKAWVGSAVRALRGAQVCGSCPCEPGRKVRSGRRKASGDLVERPDRVWTSCQSAEDLEVAERVLRTQVRCRSPGRRRGGSGEGMSRYAGWSAPGGRATLRG